MHIGWQYYSHVDYKLGVKVDLISSLMVTLAFAILAVTALDRVHSSLL